MAIGRQKPKRDHWVRVHGCMGWSLEPAISSVIRTDALKRQQPMGNHSGTWQRLATRHSPLFPCAEECTVVV